MSQHILHHDRHNVVRQIVPHIVIDLEFRSRDGFGCMPAMLNAQQFVVRTVQDQCRGSDFYFLGSITSIQMAVT